MGTPVYIIGIGSPFGADRIGWRVIDQLRCHPVVRDWGNRVRLSTLDRPGPRLIEQWQGADHVILIDGVLSGATPGTIRRWQERDLPTIRSMLSSHGFGVAETVALARTLGNAPLDLIVLGVELGEDGSVPHETAAAAAAAVIDEVTQVLEVSHA